jgi:thiamine-monophosphate kinase
MAAALTPAGMGEDALVRRLLGLLPQNGPGVVVGPGDDCAVVSVPGACRLQLLKTDSVVEGVHYLSGEKMRRVGWKALCRAISDVAAMGGIPEHALVSIAVPSRMEWMRLRELYAGIAKAADAYQVSVVGGETVHTSGPLVCSIFLTGSVDAAHCLRRSGGMPGDLLFVTGRLGGSLASGWHLDFKPRLQEGRWLARSGHVRAMMDISDGLASDLPRLAKASGCGAELHLDSVPRHRGRSLLQACCDGEDFELLMAVVPEDADMLLNSWQDTFPKLPLTQVGRLMPKRAGLRPAGLFKMHGYDHFQ